VARWGTSHPQNVIRLDRVGELRSHSVWAARGARNAQASDSLRAPEEPRGEIVLVPRVYVTLCASCVEPREAAANDSTLVVSPARVSAHALCALINSLPSRYYHFLAMRAAILLRRRSTLYPRTIEHLPCPDLDEAGRARLDELSREAHRLCAEADVDEVRLAGSAAEGWRDTRPAAVLFDFAGWPDGRRAAGPEAGAAEVDGQALTLGGVTVRGDAAGLKLLAWLLQAAEGASEREVAAAVALPRSPEERQRVVVEIESRVAARGALRDRLGEVEEEIDEIVMDGLGLSADQKQTLRERCRQFPLSETVMRPRYLWSEDRKRQKLRRYEGGERYR